MIMGVKVDEIGGSARGNEFGRNRPIAAALMGGSATRNLPLLEGCKLGTLGLSTVRNHG